MLPNQKLLDEISVKINQAIRNSPARDMEKNVRAMMQTALQKLDLVTREEFDVQQEVLLRTREKLIELESRLALLEALAPAPASEHSQSPVL